MKKEYRIKKSSEIENILKGKQSVGNKNFSIYYKNNENHFRFAISVSKKLGKAFLRNYQKRKIREVFKAYQEILLPYDIFIICKAGSISLPHLETKQELYYLLNKASLVKEKQ